VDDRGLRPRPSAWAAADSGANLMDRQYALNGLIETVTTATSNAINEVEMWHPEKKFEVIRTTYYTICLSILHFFGQILS
jgi:hypothetical protein